MQEVIKPVDDTGSQASALRWGSICPTVCEIASVEKRTGSRTILGIHVSHLPPVHLHSAVFFVCNPRRMEKDTDSQHRHKLVPDLVCSATNPLVTSWCPAEARKKRNLFHVMLPSIFNSSSHLMLYISLHLKINDRHSRLFHPNTSARTKVKGL